jgi:rubrerythrin
MEDIEKLRHLIGHWFEHNAEHVKNYLHWADVADENGRAELAAVLRRMANETGKMEELLKQARKALD